jgi:hypothetical protein
MSFGYHCFRCGNLVCRVNPLYISRDCTVAYLCDKCYTSEQKKKERGE